MNRPENPAEAFVYDLENMLVQHREGRATAQDMVWATERILDNYRLQIGAGGRS